MQSEKQWYIVYTQTGKELKALYSLNKKNIECFCPLSTSVLKLRNKTVESPLLPNYIFVCIHASECAAILKTDGIKNFMYWLDKPVILENEDIFLLKQLTGKYKFLTSERIKVNPTLATTKSWTTASVAIDNDFDEEDVMTVSFPAYGFAITAKESKVNVRVINVNVRKDSYLRRQLLSKR